MDPAGVFLTPTELLDHHGIATLRIRRDSIFQRQRSPSHERNRLRLHQREQDRGSFRVFLEIMATSNCLPNVGVGMIPQCDEGRNCRFRTKMRERPCGCRHHCAIGLSEVVDCYRNTLRNEWSVPHRIFQRRVEPTLASRALSRLHFPRHNRLLPFQTRRGCPSISVR